MQTTLVAAGQQGFAKMRPQETGAAGDEDASFGHLDMIGGRMAKSSRTGKRKSGRARCRRDNS
jgi:hypothetical protein